MIADWSILEVDGVIEQAKRAAHAINNKYPNVSEYDDLYQEALLRLATHPAPFRKCLDDPTLGLHGLRYSLRCDLEDKIRPEAKRKIRTTSYEEAREGHE